MFHSGGRIVADLGDLCNCYIREITGLCYKKKEAKQAIRYSPRRENIELGCL